MVVGAGPAGLAASALSAGGVEHTVLERARPGESWRTQGWDSFCRSRPPEADPTDAPVALEPPGTLDLRAEEIGSVIWCTGFGGDFSDLDPTLLDADGQPRRRGAGAAPGLWYLGLRWLTRRRSGILFGFPDDAAAVTDAVQAQL